MTEQEYKQQIGKIHKMYDPSLQEQHDGHAMLILTQERNDHPVRLTQYYHAGAGPKDQRKKP